MTRKRTYCIYASLSAGSGGQLVIAKLPEGGVRWGAIAQGLGRIAMAHGKKASDVSGFSGLCDTLDGPYAGWDARERAENADLLGKVERAFAGDQSLFGPFECWAWDGELQVFKLVRAAKP